MSHSSSFDTEERTRQWGTTVLLMTTQESNTPGSTPCCMRCLYPARSNNNHTIVRRRQGRAQVGMSLRESMPQSVKECRLEGLILMGIDFKQHIGINHTSIIGVASNPNQLLLELGWKRSLSAAALCNDRLNMMKINSIRIRMHSVHRVCRIVRFTHLLLRGRIRK